MKLKSRMVIPEELVNVLLTKNAYEDQHKESIRLRAEQEGLVIGEIHKKELGLQPACFFGSEEFPWEHGDSYVTDFYAEAV